MKSIWKNWLAVNRTCRQNLLKMYSGVAFIVAVVAAFFLLASSYIYIDDMNGKAYSILTLLFAPDRQTIIEKGGICARDIFLQENNGYIWMFAPIVSAIPYISIICMGNINNNIRFEIFRTGKSAYLWGNLLAAGIAGGSVMSISYIMYGIAEFFIITPHAGTGDVFQYYIATPWIHTIYSVGGIIVLYILRVLAAFLFGVFSVIPSFILSAFLRNKYLVLCIPFMLNYFGTMFLGSITGKLMKYGKRYTAIRLQYLLPASMQGIFVSENKEMGYKILFMVVSLLLSGIIYYICLERRCDCGTK